jgi:Arc/MetJ-type ribon-helix-helix transcriptional regulator
VPKIEVSLPDRIDTEIDRLVEAGEFVNRDQAVEELLSMGTSAYQETSPDEPEDEWVMQSAEDQQDPALRDDPDDERTF